MPNMTPITIKKNDGTTDVVFTDVQPSAGDKSPAMWRAKLVGANRSVNPWFSMVSRDNASRSARVQNLRFVIPLIQTDASTTLQSSRGECLFKGECVYPVTATEAEINEFVAQAANIMKHALIQQALKDGYAPT